MIYNFKFDYDCLAKGFLHIHNELTKVFWKQKEQHNYKQIVYYKEKQKLVPIKTENDFKIFLEKFYWYELYMAFIPKHHFASIDEAINHAAPFHKDISCGGCGIQPIIGTVYKCLDCPNFQLCEVCEADKHHPQHMMLVIKTSQIIAQSITAEQQCHNCAVESIIGFRYKCIFCTNRIFCESCTNNKPLPCRNHGMIRFPDRSGETAAGTVVSQANFQSVEDRQFKILNNKLDQVLEVIASGGLNIAAANGLQRVNTGESEQN